MSLTLALFVSINICVWWYNGTIPISLNCLVCASEKHQIKWKKVSFWCVCPWNRRHLYVRLALGKLFTNFIISKAMDANRVWHGMRLFILFSLLFHTLTYSVTAFTQLNYVNSRKCDKACEQTSIISIGHIRTIMKCSGARQVSLTHIHTHTNSALCSVIQVQSLY